jgi:hypothetical protein
MKPSKFQKAKATHEKRKNRTISNGEFDGVLRKRRVSQWIGNVLAFIVGLAMIAEWPSAWIGPFTIYVGWAFVVLILVSFARDAVTKEGTFYRREATGTVD